MMKKKTVASACAALALAACASNPGVAPMGGDAYHVARQGAAGFSDVGNLRAEALREADAYCRAQNRTMSVTGGKDSKPPYILGNFPRAEVEFRCVESK